MKKILLFFLTLFTGLFQLNISCMADEYSSTTLLAARDMVSERLLKQTEQRKNMSTIINCAMASNAILNPTLVGSSVTGQTAQIMYNKNKVFTAQTAFSCTPSGEQGGSGVASVSFVDRTVVGYVGKSQAAKTQGGYASILANELYNMEKTLLYSTVDAYIVTNVLDAYPSTVNRADGMPNTLNVNVMEMLKDDVKRFYSLIRSDMGVNNYDNATMFYDITNTSFKALHAAYGFGGVSNQVDSPEANGITQYLSNGLTVDAAYSSKHYIIPEGTLYFIPRVPARFDNENRGTYQRSVYPSTMIPGLNLVLTRFMACGDKSSYGGVAADDYDTFELGIEFATGLIPNSNSGEYFNYVYGTLAT